MKPKEVDLSKLVLDYQIYPRTQVSDEHVVRLMEAMMAGASIPPIVADAKSMRVVDGFHRYEAARRLGLDKIQVELKVYPNEASIYADAGKRNANHGRPFTPQDCRRFILRAEELGLSREMIAEILQVTRERVEKWAIQRAEYAGRPVPIKRGLEVLAGKKLTPKQKKLNENWGGMNALFYANQLILYLESGIEITERLAEALDRLVELWNEVRAAV